MKCVCDTYWNSIAAFFFTFLLSSFRIRGHDSNIDTYNLEAIHKDIFFL